MYWISKSIHGMGRLRRRGLILLAVIGPGIITMVADNDAGGISTYAQTGAKTGFNLLWAFIILVPMAYYVQEMTVRLGAVTKRGHAEAIFDAFGPVWGWFSIFDLALINWLTLVTEYIGMTQAMRIFGIPEWITFLGVTLLMFGVVMSGKYWTFEKITFVFCLFNLVYIPAAIWAMQTGNVPGGWEAVGRGFYWPTLRGITAGRGDDHAHHGEHRHDDHPLADLLPAERRGGQGHGPPRHRARASSTPSSGHSSPAWWRHSSSSPPPACSITIPGGQIVVESAAETAEECRKLCRSHHWGEWAKVLFAIGLFDAGLLGALCISLSTSWAVGEVFGWAHSLNKSVREAPWFYVVYLVMLISAGIVSLGCHHR